MKRTWAGVLSGAILASILPLAGCDSGGDTGMPTDTTPGVPLDSLKADMGAFKKEQASKKNTSESKPGAPAPESK
jgi:hypothetical protein